MYRSTIIIITAALFQQTTAMFPAENAVRARLRREEDAVRARLRREHESSSSNIFSRLSESMTAPFRSESESSEVSTFDGTPICGAISRNVEREVAQEQNEKVARPGAPMVPRDVFSNDPNEPTHVHPELSALRIVIGLDRNFKPMQDILKGKKILRNGLRGLDKSVITLISSMILNTKDIDVGSTIEFAPRNGNKNNCFIWERLDPRSEAEPGNRPKIEINFGDQGKVMYYDPVKALYTVQLRALRREVAFPMNTFQGQPLMVPILINIPQFDEITGFQLLNIANPFHTVDNQKRALRVSEFKNERFDEVETFICFDGQLDEANDIQNYFGEVSDIEKQYQRDEHHIPEWSNCFRCRARVKTTWEFCMDCNTRNRWYQSPQEMSFRQRTDVRYGASRTVTRVHF